MPADALAALIAELPEGMVVTDPAVTESYRQDRAFDPSAGKPAAVVRPRRTEQVQTVLRWATANQVPVVTRGMGTGLSGGATAVDGGIVLSTEKMRDIAVDPVTRTAVCQPGLLNAEVKKAVAEYGLWYPPDPSSWEICSIGGNIATNAGGLCCVKYGVTTDYVLGVQVVLADGTAVRLGGPRLKDVAGLSLTKLFVGSEGTLGVITEVTLRLVPPQQPLATVVAYFASVEAAAQAVLGVTSRLRPAMLEFMDSATINAVEDKLRMGLDRGAAAMLVAASDERGQCRQRRRRADGGDIHRIRCDGSVFDRRPGRERGVHRRAQVRHPGSRGEGAAAARRRRRAGAGAGRSGQRDRAIAAQHDLMIAVIAHAGDGNTHPLIVHDPNDAAELERANLAYGEIMNLAMQLGGTITGEHGVGRLKRPWLAGYLGPDAMALNQRIKDALDPQGILNPGAGV